MAKRTNEDELNRHPQAEDVEEVVEENATAEYDEATTEENSVVETTCPEDEDDVEDDDASEDEDEDEDEDDVEEREMTKSEARDYVDEDIDNKFMEDTAPERMTPEKAQREIRKCAEDINEFSKRAGELERIAELASHEGFNDFVTEIKNINCKAINEGNIKDAKKMTKILEATELIFEKVRNFKKEYDLKIGAIKRYSDRIEQIREMGFQLSFDDQLKDRTKNAQDPELEKNQTA